MGYILVRLFDFTKEMILTHGECERSSIVLGRCRDGWYEEGKKKAVEAGRLFSCRCACAKRDPEAVSLVGLNPFYHVTSIRTMAVFPKR